MRSPVFLIVSALFFTGYYQLTYAALASLPMVKLNDPLFFAGALLVLLPLSVFTARWVLRALADTIN
ncbi:MAG: hypothetical protein VB100_04260 [Angelakisella sp.]|nr:hypothetical protein [Angelakisella sp.]